MIAAIDWLAVARGWKPVEYIAKPAVMLALLGWVALQSAAARAWPPPLSWFALGLCLSLLGDVLLMLPARLFLAGLVAFLFAHLAYIAGFSIGGLPLGLGTLALAVPMAGAAAWLTWRVAKGLAARGAHKLQAPVAGYSLVLSLMVMAALTTLIRSDWARVPAVLVAAGAVLFFASDGLLAWNRFVAPLRHGSLLVIVAYHLGQIALIAGVTMHLLA